MNGCEARFEQISMLIDGELDEEKAAEVRAHIAACPDCAAVYALLSGVGGALEEDVPAGLHEKIMKSVDQAERVKKAQRRFTVLRPALTAAACLVVIVGTILLTGNLMHSRKAAPETAMSLASGVSASSAKAAAAPAAPAAAASADEGMSITAYNAGAVENDAVSPEAPMEMPAAVPEPMPEAVAEESEAGADWLESSLMAVPAAANECFTGRVEELREDGTLRLTVTECGSSSFVEGDSVLTALSENGTAYDEAGAIEVGKSVYVILTETPEEAQALVALGETLYADSIEVLE